jgi:hypothetical protein
MTRLPVSLISAALLGAAALGACSDDLTSVNGSNGRLVVRLTDAPFLTDSVKSVDIFVVRVDGRLAQATDAEAEADADNANKGGWNTLASPNASINLLALQNGVSTTLGDAELAEGTYNGFRLVIDPSKSSITLKNGKVLTGNDDPGIKFPSADKSGIKIQVAEGVKIVGGGVTTLLVDFDVNQSFVQRGNSIEKNGLLFKPVIKATIVDAATVNATFRFANATNDPLSLLLNNNPLTGATSLAFGTSSTCSSVNAATPLLSVIKVGTTTPLLGFAPTLAVGTSYVLLAYPNATGIPQFATLGNTFAPTTGQAGFRVFNATGGATGLDVFVTASGATLGTATVTNALTGVASSFVSVPTGVQQIRITNTGSTSVLLDMGTQTLTAGQNITVVVAPPAAGGTAPRAFIVAGC